MLNKAKLESSLSLNCSLHSWKNQCKPTTVHFVIMWKTELGARFDHFEQAFHPYKWAFESGLECPWKLFVGWDCVIRGRRYITPGPNLLMPVIPVP